MNYAEHYRRLMERARLRVLDGYVERHHVVPRCLDKNSTDVVRLTPEEHYVAHQLLVKMHPGNAKLVFAANRMSHGSRKAPRKNKAYGWVRRAFAVASSESQRGREFKDEWRAALCHPWTEARRAAYKAHLKGKPWSAARRAAAKPPPNKGMTGGTLSEEHCAKLSAAQLRRYEEHPELKVQHSLAIKRYYDKIGRKPKILRDKDPSATQFVKGQKAWNEGKSWGPEVIAKMSKPRSPEGRAAIAAAARLRAERQRAAKETGGNHA